MALSHWIFTAAAASPLTLRGRIQPAKALGSVTSTSPPQFDRSKARHASKSNRGVSRLSPLWFGNDPVAPCELGELGLNMGCSEGLKRVSAGYLICTKVTAVACGALEKCC